MYIPPITISAKAINLIAEISAKIERYAIRLEQSDGLRLRKANRIKTIHSSLAMIREEPQISAATVALNLGVSDRTARSYFAKLKAEGYIERIGSNKSGYWKIVSSKE